VRWSRPCEPIENDPIAEVDPLHVVVDASLLAGALIDAEGPIGRRYRRRLSELVDGDQANVLRTLTKLEVVAALTNNCNADSEAMTVRARSRRTIASG
jgi:hypothetical protein